MNTGFTRPMKQVYGSTKLLIKSVSNFSKTLVASFLKIYLDCRNENKNC